MRRHTARLCLAAATALAALGAPAVAHADASSSGATVERSEGCYPFPEGYYCARTWAVAQDVRASSGVVTFISVRRTEVSTYDDSGALVVQYVFSNRGRVTYRDGQVVESHSTMRTRDLLTRCDTVVRFHVTGERVQFDDLRTTCHPSSADDGTSTP